MIPIDSSLARTSDRKTSATRRRLWRRRPAAKTATIGLAVRLPQSLGALGTGTAWHVPSCPRPDAPCLHAQRLLTIRTSDLLPVSPLPAGQSRSDLPDAGPPWHIRIRWAGGRPDRRRSSTTCCSGFPQTRLGWPPAQSVDARDGRGLPVTWWASAAERPRPLVSPRAAPQLSQGSVRQKS